MAFEQVYEWNASDIVGSFAGVPFKALADDEFINVEPASESFGTVQSVDGPVTYYGTNDQRATVTVRFVATSESVAGMTALQNADLAALNGAGVGVLEIRNTRTGEMLFDPKARIVKRPNTQMAKAPGVREFPIFCPHLKYTPASVAAVTP